MHAPALLCALLGSTVALAQTITFAEGSPTSLSIVAVAESDPNGGDTVLLQDVELLDLELTGRTLAQATDPSRARLLTLQGIARAELPGGSRLFRYRRAAGAFWGFLHIAADGTPRVVLEHAGSGPTGSDNPYFDRIAVSPDGLFAAVARPAGGAWLIRLDGTVFPSTGRADRQIAANSFTVLPLSLLVGSQFVAYQTENPTQVWRCSTADGAAPVNVSPAPAPGADFKDQMVLSRDGSTLVYLYGPQNLQRLWLVGTTGPATLLPPLPSKYEEPGYLPEDPGEPAMLLSDDGARLFYIDSDVRDELYLLDTAGSLPTLPMTVDAVFQPYIGAHILPRFAAGKLTIAIGDPGQMDWFQADLAPTGGTVVNLTGTGSLAQPFPSGTVDPRHAVDGGNYLLVSELGSGGMVLRRVDPATGAQAIVQQGLTEAPSVGTAATGTADVVVRTLFGDSLVHGPSGLTLATLPQGLLLTPPVAGPDYLATWLHLDIGWGITAYYLHDGSLLFGQLDFQLQQIALTALGGTVELGSTVRYLAPATAIVLNRPAVARRLCLSGVGS